MKTDHTEQDAMETVVEPRLASSKPRGHWTARKSAGRRAKKVAGRETSKPAAAQSSYPRHAIDKCIRIPKAIIDQNAGQECTEADAAGFTGVGKGGQFRLEISSCIKFMLLERPSTGRVRPTDLAKQIIRPQKPEDELSGLRKAVVNAPCIGDVYSYYRGENLPDDKFFRNALAERFRIPGEKVDEFLEVFLSSLSAARLIDESEGKRRILDISEEVPTKTDAEQRQRALRKDVRIVSGDTCFVMMPFGPPVGDYYVKVYEPAIEKAGLVPVRADTEIFGTGKIIEQVWRGISDAKVLLAELTSRNPNVFYELGLAHAAGKPVVLVSSNQDDVPFDLQHIRVIYYDVYDPFWGTKLIEKVAENILSALSNPDEALFERAVMGER